MGLNLRFSHLTTTATPFKYDKYKVFLKSFFKYKKKNYPVHTPAAADYIMFNFGDFLSEILYGELF
jgi:hypothetical protein